MRPISSRMAAQKGFGETGLGRAADGVGHVEGEEIAGGEKAVDGVLG